MMTTTKKDQNDANDGVVHEIQHLCTVNEVFLLRQVPITKRESRASTRKGSPHAIVISLTSSASPSKATQFSTLGVEPNPFYVSILHPCAYREFRLCCASIGPLHTFRPDILRAALRVYVPPHDQGCKSAAWTKAISWFWKTMEKQKGQKCTRGKQWIPTGGLDFWTSLKQALDEQRQGDQDTVDVDIQLGRKVLLDCVIDLLRRNERLFVPRRHVLHTDRIRDPVTLGPAIRNAEKSDDGYGLLCGIDPAVTDVDRTVLRCYDRLFDKTGPLFHEPVVSANDEEMAWTRLVDLRFAKRHGMASRTFYYSPNRIRAEALEAFCRPPHRVVDAGLIEEDRPLDLLARLLIFPVDEYLLIYDSTVTPDSPLRQLILAQFHTTPHDLTTNVFFPVDPRTSAMTRRIREVASRVCVCTTDDFKALDDPLIKTVFLLDFHHWRLRQLVKLCKWFTMRRIMSRAHATWVALNITVPRPAPVIAVDPIDWTKDTHVSSVIAWFDRTFLEPQ